MMDDFISGLRFFRDRTFLPQSLDVKTFTDITCFVEKLLAWAITDRDELQHWVAAYSEL